MKWEKQPQDSPYIKKHIGDPQSPSERWCNSGSHFQLLFPSVFALWWSSFQHKKSSHVLLTQNYQTTFFVGSLAQESKFRSVCCAVFWFTAFMMYFVLITHETNFLQCIRTHFQSILSTFNLQSRKWGRSIKQWTQS